MISDHELIAMYKSLKRQTGSPHFGEPEAAELILVCIELGQRGYTLTPDETDWVKKAPGKA